MVGFGALQAGVFVGVVACAALSCLFAYGVGVWLVCLPGLFACAALVSVCLRRWPFLELLVVY